MKVWWFALGVFLSGLSYGQSENSRIFQIKIEKSAARKILSKQLPNKAMDAIQTHHPALNSTNKKYQASTLKRVFPFAGKFEEQHIQYGLDQWFYLAISSDESDDQIIQSYKSLDLTEEFLPVLKTGFADSESPVVLNDPRYNDLWYLNNTGQTGGTPSADVSFSDGLDIFEGTKEVVVAVIDQGIDFNHQDLSLGMWTNSSELNGIVGVDDDNNGYIDDIHGYNFLNNSAVITPLNHGTHVAGTVNALNNNGLGISSIGGGDQVKIMTLQVFDAQNGGGYAEALVYAADNGASIAQNSWGYLSPNVYDPSVLDAIDYFIANAGSDENGLQKGPIKGGLVVFAAGNSNSSQQYFPAAYESVIAVGATDMFDKRAYYSNYGDYIDVMAPGGDKSSGSAKGILSTFINNSYGYDQGTSMSAPLVSATLAKMISQYADDSLLSKQMEQLLYYSTDKIDELSPGFEGKMGHGRINLQRALQIGNDVTPPSTVNSLQADSVGLNFAYLSWNESTDNWGVPNYLVVISKDTITEENWHLAERVDTIATLHSTQMLDTITALQSNQWYYLAVLANDVMYNQSQLTEVIKIKTLSPAALSFISDTLRIQLNANQQFETEIEVNNIGDLAGYVKLKQLLPYPISGKTLLKSERKARGGEYSIRTDITEYYWQEHHSNKNQYQLEDDSFVEVSLPFQFWFYEQWYNRVFISSNGFVSFSDDMPAVFTPASIPSLEAPNAIIAPLYKDFNPEINGSISSSWDENQWMIEYDSLYALDGSGYYSFQLILFRNGDIRVNYKNAPGSQLNLLQLEDGLGLNFIKTTPLSAVKEHSIYMEGPHIFTRNLPTDSVKISGNKSEKLGFLLAADGLSSGVYYNKLLLESSAITGFNTKVLELTVKPSPYFSVASDSVYLGNTYNGIPISNYLVFSNTGNDSLIVTSIGSDNNSFQFEFAEKGLATSHSDSIYVTFTPNESGLVVENIEVFSNDPRGSTVMRLYTQVLPRSRFKIIPDTLRLVASPHDSIVFQMQVENSGDADLIFNSGIGPEERSVSFSNQNPDYPYYLTESSNFSWNDISTSGVKVLMGSNSRYGVNLDFNFSFFDQIFTKIWIYENGIIGFENVSEEFFLMEPDKNTGPLHPFIAVLMSDLQQMAESQIHFKKLTDRILIQYDKMGVVGYPEKVSAQVVLYSNGIIEMFYLNESANAIGGMQNITAEYGMNWSGWIAQKTHLIISPQPSFYGYQQADSVSVIPLGTEILNQGIFVSNLSPTTHTGYISFWTDDPENQLFSVPFYLSVLGGNAKMVTNKPVLEFAPTYIGNQKTLSLLLQNAGGSGLKIDSIRLKNGVDFQLLSFSDSLPPYDESKVYFSFSPNEVGTMIDSVSVYSSHSEINPLNIKLVGSGLDLPRVWLSTTELNFPVTETGSTTEKIIKISNTGTDMLVISNLTSYSGSFIPTLSNTSINYADTAVFQVIFDPFGVGQKTGNIKFNTNDPDQPLVNLTMNGFSIAPLGIENKWLENIVIYPNPFSNQLSIKGMNDDSKASQLIITDLQGKVVFKLNSITSDHIIINTSNWSEGIFVVQLIENEKLTIQKILKIKNN